ncbi:MAG: F0F1 ATP synthase subunit B [Clostridia bacterium]|nr:F0F1 ATP synthase subunit B [Clostridia bacterium]
MQSLDVISVNLWQILISIANLIILFFLIKKFLFKPVKKMLANRQADLDKLYRAADEAKEKAEESENYWKEKLDSADAEAEAIMQKATDSAKWRSEKILEEAKDKADGIIRQAETEAVLERKKATEGIKKEIVSVSTALTEKLLSREINIDDHRSMIDSAIKTIGDDNDANE